MAAFTAERSGRVNRLCCASRTAYLRVRRERIPSNDILEQEVAELLTRPVG